MGTLLSNREETAGNKQFECVSWLCGKVLKRQMLLKKQTDKTLHPFFFSPTEEAIIKVCPQLALLPCLNCPVSACMCESACSAAGASLRVEGVGEVGDPPWDRGLANMLIIGGWVETWSTVLQQLT